MCIVVMIMISIILTIILTLILTIIIFVIVIVIIIKSFALAGLHDRVAWAGGSHVWVFLNVVGERADGAGTDIWQMSWRVRALGCVGLCVALAHAEGSWQRQ